MLREMVPRTPFAPTRHPPRGHARRTPAERRPRRSQSPPCVAKWQYLAGNFSWATGRRRGLHATPTGPAERPGERTGPAPATASADPVKPRPDPVGRTLPGRPDHESVLVGCPSHSCLSASKLTVHVPHGLTGHGMKCLYTILANGRAARWASERRPPAIVSRPTRGLRSGSSIRRVASRLDGRLEDATLRTDRRHHDR